MSAGLFTPELLERCISCGFCLPACPTYRLTGSEPSSPRGRINLMRAVEEGRLSVDDPGFVEESSFCLGCRACEPVCPAGVRYGELLEEWRGHVVAGPETGRFACARCSGRPTGAGACAPSGSSAGTPARGRSAARSSCSAASSGRSSRA